VGDGASVFLIFILGFTVIPAAVLLELHVHPPFWVHLVLWTPASALMLAALMPAVKAYIILLEWRHRKKE
jgi:uncharacterized protein (DUF983 family)